MMLSLTTVPTAAGPSRFVGRRAAFIVAALLAFAAAAIVFAILATTVPTLGDVDREMQETRRLVNEGYLPAEVLEPAG